MKFQIKEKTNSLKIKDYKKFIDIMNKINDFTPTISILLV
jgi:hypothetical protein